MYVSEAALNKLQDAYRTNNKVLDVTITRMKTIDIDNCRTEKDILILAFTDGTEERINACDYHSDYETGDLLDGDLRTEMVVSIDDVNGDFVSAYGMDITNYYCL